MKLPIEHAHDLRDIGVPPAEAADFPSHLVLALLVELSVADERRLQRGSELALDVLPGLAVREDDLCGFLDVRLIVEPIPPDLFLHPVEEVGVDLLGQRGLGIEAAERFADHLGVVHEVEDVGILLVRMDAVHAADGLDGLHVLELLVYHQGVQQGLIEARLVLLGDDEHVAVVVELLLRLAFGDARAVVAHVQGGLSVLALLGVVGIDDRAGERHEDLHVVVALLLHVALHLVVIAYGGEARRGDDHHLALAFYLGAGDRTEGLDDDLGLLSQRVRVQLLVAPQQLERRARRHVGVLGDGLGEFEGLGVGDVVSQGIHDEPLLDRLAHRVDVERMERPVGKLLAEYLERLLLGGRRERAEREVLVPPVGRQLISELVFPVGGALLSLRLDLGILFQRVPLVR